MNDTLVTLITFLEERAATYTAYAETMGRIQSWHSADKAEHKASECLEIADILASMLSSIQS